MLQAVVKSFRRLSHSHLSLFFLNPLEHGFTMTWTVSCENGDRSQYPSGWRIKVAELLIVKTWYDSLLHLKSVPLVPSPSPNLASDSIYLALRKDDLGFSSWSTIVPVRSNFSPLILAIVNSLMLQLMWLSLLHKHTLTESDVIAKGVGLYSEITFVNSIPVYEFLIHLSSKPP